MRVICAGEMLVDIFVRPVQQIPFENDTQIARHPHYQRR